MVTVQPWSIEGHVVQFLQLHRKEPGVARALLQLLVSGNWALTRIVAYHWQSDLYTKEILTNNQHVKYNSMKHLKGQQLLFTITYIESEVSLKILNHELSLLDLSLKF